MVPAGPQPGMAADLWKLKARTNPCSPSLLPKRNSPGNQVLLAEQSHLQGAGTPLTPTWEPLRWAQTPPASPPPVETSLCSVFCFLSVRCAALYTRLIGPEMNSITCKDRVLSKGSFWTCLAHPVLSKLQLGSSCWTLLPGVSRCLLHCSVRR